MTFWPAPSKYALADACGFPWGPNAPRWPPRSTYVPTPDALFGRAVSRVVELCVTWGADALVLVDDVAQEQGLADDQTLRLHSVSEAIATDLDEIRPSLSFCASEVVIVLNVASGRVRWGAGGEGFRPPSGCISGTLDVLAVRADGTVVIRDYKSGFKQARELVSRRDPQIRAYALMAGRLFRGSRVVVELAHVHEEGVRVDFAAFDALELGLIHQEIRDRMQRVSATTTPTPGPHCRRCPIVSACPVTGKALERAVAATDAYPIVADPKAIQSAEHAASMHRRLTMIEEGAPRIRAALQAWVLEHGDVEIEPGVFYGRVVVDGREKVTLDVPRAAEVVRKHLGEGAGWEAGVELDASKASLERGAKARAKELGIEGRGSVKQVLDPLLSELREMGAIKQGAPFEKVSEFKKKNQEKNA